MCYTIFFKELKMKLFSNIITYDQAAIKAKPILDEMNSKAVKIAKKHGKKPTKFTFAGMIR